MYHIVYLTTNKVNQKFYIGVHHTYDLDDGYLGSGKYLVQSIKKYGKENFERKILYFCLSKHDAHCLEKIIVDYQFVKRKDTYNLAIGGYGGNTIAGFDEERYKTFLDRCSKAQKGKIVSNETKNLMILNHADVNGSKNPRARKILCIKPNGEEIVIFGNIIQFAKEQKISRDKIIDNLDKGKINLDLNICRNKKSRSLAENVNGFEFISI